MLKHDCGSYTQNHSIARIHQQLNVTNFFLPDPHHDLTSEWLLCVGWDRPGLVWSGYRAPLSPWPCSLAPWHALVSHHHITCIAKQTSQVVCNYLRNCCWLCCCCCCGLCDQWPVVPALLWTWAEPPVETEQSMWTHRPFIADDRLKWPLSSKMKMVSSYQGKLPIRAWNHPSEETCTGNWDGTQTSKTWIKYFCSKTRSNYFSLSYGRSWVVCIWVTRPTVTVLSFPEREDKKQNRPND